MIGFFCLLFKAILYLVTVMLCAATMGTGYYGLDIMYSNVLYEIGNDQSTLDNRSD